MKHPDSTLYFLSRFPRFMGPQEGLWRRERVYRLYSGDELCAYAVDFSALARAPSCYADFARACAGDVDAWPVLYVHRLAPAKHAAVCGDPQVMIRQFDALDGAQLVGNICDVQATLRAGGSVRKLRKISVGGNNRFEVPFPQAM